MNISQKFAQLRAPLPPKLPRKDAVWYYLARLFAKSGHHLVTDAELTFNRLLYRSSFEALTLTVARSWSDDQ